MIATTIEQSARLLKCGVPADTADMYYLVDNLHIGYVISAQNPPKGVTLAWSLSQLTNLLPAFIMLETSRYDMTIGHPISNKKLWRVTYHSMRTCRSAFKSDEDSLIEACVKAIEWLTENGYKLNEIK